jgi:RNA polymerase sigma-70 factor (ECF subfamily)
LRIAKIVVAGYYRKREKQPAVLSLQYELLDESLTFLGENFQADPASQAEIEEDWQQVVQAMNQLTEEQRQVLVGRLILGYDVAAMARLIGKKANAVKALQFRALQRLQRLLGKA